MTLILIRVFNIQTDMFKALAVFVQNMLEAKCLGGSALTGN